MQIQHILSCSCSPVCYAKRYLLLCHMRVSYCATCESIKYNTVFQCSQLPIHFPTPTVSVGRRQSILSQISPSDLICICRILCPQCHAGSPTDSRASGRSPTSPLAGCYWPHVTSAYVFNKACTIDMSYGLYGPILPCRQSQGSNASGGSGISPVADYTTAAATSICDLIQWSDWCHSKVTSKIKINLKREHQIPVTSSVKQGMCSAQALSLKYYALPCRQPPGQQCK